MPALSQILIFISYFGTVFSLGLALLGLFAPTRAMKLVGLTPRADAPHAISEVRATYGGVFFGVTAFALATGNPIAFLALASCWLCAMVARIASIILDNNANQHNLVSVGVEGSIGLAVAAPHFAIAQSLLGF